MKKRKKSEQVQNSNPPGTSNIFILVYTNQIFRNILWKKFSLQYIY